jgi:hypothetical protein
VSAEFSIQQPHRHTPSPDERIAAFARRQHGLVTLLQLLVAGLVRSQVARRVAAGRLHWVHRGVYSLGPVLSREARFLAATLAAGERSALSHLSSAELRGISRFRSPVIAVVSPRLRIIEGVQLHRYRKLDPRDITTYNGIPVTTIHRTQVDLTDVLTPHQLTNVIYQAAYKGLYVEPATRDAMARANGRRNLHVLDRAIALYNSGSAGTRSGAEDAFLRLDFPEPLVNVGFEGFEVDFRWPDLRLAVEIDGSHHGRPPDRAADARQDQALQGAGYETLRFTDEEVHHRPQQILWALNAYR